MTLDEFIKELKPYLDKDMVIFTGAGLSTASGIKDFRGKNGLFKEKINAEEILSHHFFMENPIEFYKFFRDKLINDNVKPNLMHEVIMAGTKNVIEIHGNAQEFYCIECGIKHNLSYVNETDEVPTCRKCGGILKPNIVLYEEPLNQIEIWDSQKLIKSAKSMLVLGSTLRVNPAAGLVEEFVEYKEKDESKKLFIVNMGATNYDQQADYKYDGDIIEVAKKIKEYKKEK